MKNMEKLVEQILKFGVVGGLAFLIDSIVLYVLTDFFGIYYFYSSLIAFIVSLVFNYILSIKWVFDVEKKQTIKEVALFVFLSLIGLLINQSVMYISVEIVKIHYMIGKIISTFIVMVYNFITRKIFIEDKK